MKKSKGVFIIAELSANHNGDIETAKKTVIAAKNSGADAIKLQTYTADTMTINSSRVTKKLSNNTSNCLVENE